MHQSLIESRPFNQFVEMEMERDSLYFSFLDLDEPKEISESWITFAESCAKNLSSINSFASMAYERISDVNSTMKRTDDSTNPLPLHSLLYGDMDKQMLALSQFQLQLGVLSYLYSQVRNRGVFDHVPDDKQYLYYILSKESLDLILYRILNRELVDVQEKKRGLTPVPRVSELLSILTPLLQLEHRKRLIPNLLNLPDSKTDTEIIAKVGDYDKLQGITLLTHITNIAKRASDEYWWEDPISAISILDHAEEHFTNVVKLWAPFPGRLSIEAAIIQFSFLPLVKSQSILALSDHYVLLAKNAFVAGDIKHSTSYLDTALLKFDEIDTVLSSIQNRETQQFHEIAKRKKKEVEVKAIMSKISRLYNQILTNLSSNESEKALKCCTEIATLISKLDETGFQPYVYGVSVSFSSANLVIKDILSKDSSDFNVLEYLVAQFDYPLRAMATALNSINLSSIRIDDENPHKSMAMLLQIDATLEHLETAIELLPEFLENKKIQKHRVYAMRHYIKSFIYEAKIYFSADNNLILDLMLRAKAHYFAKRANNSIDELKANDNESIKSLKNIINERVLDTKVTGMLTESNLLVLGLQTSYSKTVREAFSELIEFYKNANKTDEKFVLDAITKRFEGISDFNELLELILIDTQELQALKRKVALKGREINWDYVSRRSVFIPCAKLMFEVVHSIILGEAYYKFGKYSKAETSYNNARSKLNSVSDQLSSISQFLEDQKDIPQLVYTISLVCQENVVGIRERRKKDNVPFKEVIGVLDYLTLFI